ncbi:hypothetical protein LY78DRAFT_656303 [Colletotrichum sublineola]|nr:hypothetical protein LY78DRAFT_656303 [Colletotrichum sublineola]
MSRVTDAELFMWVSGKSKPCLDDESKSQVQAEELYNTQKILEDMVEESTCGICYEPLRSMHVAGCGHSHCTQCIRKQFRQNGERHRPVPYDSLDNERKIKICAPCPTCRAKIELDLNKNGRLIVPRVIAAEKQVALLREWSQRRRAQDVWLLTQGFPLPSTACSWRRFTETGTCYKTIFEEEAEDETQWVTDEEPEEDDTEDAEYWLIRSRQIANEIALRPPRTPTQQPTASLPVPSQGGRDATQTTPTTWMTPYPAAAPSQPVGYMTQDGLFQDVLPAVQPGYVPAVYHYPPPPPPRH